MYIFTTYIHTFNKSDNITAENKRRMTLQRVNEQDRM